MNRRNGIVIGAGPAGLTAAWQLIKNGIEVTVLEKYRLVGGIARTEEHKGYRFDIGGHRFFTMVPEVEALWHEWLQEEFVVRPRKSRILYRGKFFDYPLKVYNALSGLGLWESVRIMVSYIKAQILPCRQEENFEEWVVNRFGRRLYEIFFKTYTEKVWGIKCTEIRAEWAAIVPPIIRTEPHALVLEALDLTLAGVSGVAVYFNSASLGDADYSQAQASLAMIDEASVYWAQAKSFEG